MTDENKTQPCFDCPGTMHLKHKTCDVAIGTRTKDIEVLGYWCDSCDEGIIEKEGSKAYSEAYVEIREQCNPHYLALRKYLKVQVKSSPENDEAQDELESLNAATDTYYALWRQGAGSRIAHSTANVGLRASISGYRFLLWACILVGILVGALGWYL